MKNNFLKTIFGLTLTSMLFVGCVNDDDYSVPQIECEESLVTANFSVADLKAAATTTATLYTEDHIIEGRIVSSDRGGNFYKVMYLTSWASAETAENEPEIGFSIAVNQTNNWQQYNVGRKVLVKLQGLYVQVRNNTLQIGALYNGNVGQITPADFRKHIVRTCDVVAESELVRPMSLTEAKNDNNIGKLVELTDVQFADSALGQNYYNSENVVGGETNHLLTDATDITMIFRTSSFANYAYKPVSEKSGKIIGILTKFNTDFQFVSRYETDIQLTEPRIGEEPVEPEEPEEPTGELLFAGSDFEDYATFLASIDATFGIKPYASQGIGTGIDGSNSLHLNGTPSANDYVFTALAPEGVPTNATKITFWVKGTSSAKSLSLNVYRSIGGYDVFNVGDLASSAVTLNKAALQPNGTPPNGTNSYAGTINTANQWVKITLNIADVELSTTVGQSLFAIKTGSGSVYDLHIDNITIE